MKLACRRHCRDLRASKKKSFAYRFDEAKANRACSFISKLPHVKGKWARAVRGQTNRIILQPWQLFIICSIFGWLEKSSGYRRFNEAYICVPRKNGKSVLAAAIGLYMLVADNEFGAEVYSGATKEKQAMEVFRPALQMLHRTPELKEHFGLELAVKSIFRMEDGSRFEPVVGNPGDGAMPSCAIVDEYHEHDTPILHDTMQTGMGAREQALLLNITTAGSNIAGPCYLLQVDVQKMLEGLVENDNLFGVIFTIDEGDDWKTEDSLRKANPNYGISALAPNLLKSQRQAVHSSHKQNVFKTKHLNVWVNSGNPWMNMESWRQCADPTLKLEDFLGLECFEGVDLAAKIDLASRAKIFREDRDGEWHYIYFGRHYVPLDRAMDGDHPSYEKWVHDKHLVAHPGVEIRLSLIQKEIEGDLDLYQMQCVAFDPWSAAQMQQDLEAIAADDVIISIPQTVQNLSDAMKELQAAVYAGRFHHDGDPVMAWAMSNVIAREDNNENLFPRKEKGGKSKIDPVSAALNAMNRAYVAPNTQQFTDPNVGVL